MLLPLVGASVAHGAALHVYDMLFAMHVEALGFGPSVTGAAIALGVVIEVGVLSFGERLLERVGPLWLLAIGVGATIPRFALTAFASAPWVVAAQALHGLNFGCWWLTATTLFAENAPPSVRHSSQAMLPAAAFGAGPLLGLVLAAVVLDRAETRALFAWATVLPAVGLVLIGAVARRNPVVTAAAPAAALLRAGAQRERDVEGGGVFRAVGRALGRRFAGPAGRPGRARLGVVGRADGGGRGAGLGARPVPTGPATRRARSCFRSRQSVERRPGWPFRPSPSP